MNAAKAEVSDDALKNLIENIEFLNEGQMIVRLESHDMNLIYGRGIMATEGFLALQSLCDEVKVAVVLVEAKGGPSAAGGFYNWGEILFYDEKGRWYHLCHSESLDDSNKEAGVSRSSELKVIDFEQAKAVVAAHPKEFMEQNASVVS